MKDTRKLEVAFFFRSSPLRLAVTLLKVSVTPVSMVSFGSSPRLRPRHALARFAGRGLAMDSARDLQTYFGARSSKSPKCIFHGPERVPAQTRFSQDARAA
jgi:hypothetical protein